MKRFVLIVLTVIIALSLTVGVFATDFENTTIQGLNITTDVDGAMDEAGIQNKTVALIFDQDSCVYCDMLKEDTLSNEDVQKELNENYIVVLVDINENPEIADEYQIFGTPSIEFLDDNGKAINKIEGFVDSDEFLEILKEI